MNNPATGGRGKKASYQTTHCRIPKPIKQIVELLSNKYREISGHDNSSTGEELLKQIENTILNTDKSDSYKLDIDKLNILQNELNKLKSDYDEIQRILEESLTLKSNAGGAIKNKVREALSIIHQQD